MGLLVLMIACANIAGLVLVRGVSRRGEIALRLALGATRDADRPAADRRKPRARACRAPSSASLLARSAIPILVGYAERSPRLQRIFFNIEVDGLVIGFAVLVACGSALVFGFVPALQSSRVDLVSVINEDASPRGAARGRLRAGLVVAQVAVSLLLLVGAGLATRSVDAARRANPGFDASHVTAIALDLKQNAYDEARGRVFYRQLLDAARADAGIESATLAAFMPMGLLDTRVAARRDRGLRTASRRRSGVHVEHRRLGLLPHASDHRHGRPRVRGHATTRRAAPVAIVNAHARAAILGRRRERDRQADPRRRRRVADRDRRGGGREVRADQRIAASVFLPASSCSRTDRA